MMLTSPPKVLCPKANPVTQPSLVHQRQVFPSISCQFLKSIRLRIAVHVLSLHFLDVSVRLTRVCMLSQDFGGYFWRVLRSIVWCGCTWGGGDHCPVLIHILEVIPGEEMRNRRELWSIPGSIVVQLKQGHRKQLHVFRYAEHLCHTVSDQYLYFVARRLTYYCWEALLSTISCTLLVSSRALGGMGT